MAESREHTARIAGLWYLGMAVTGPIGLVYMPSKIIAVADPATTAANVVAHELLLRVGVASSLLCQVIFVFLVLALERLFRGISENHSKLMLALVIAAVPIAVGNELFALAALELARGAATPGFDAGQRAALVSMLLNVHQHGVAVAGIFWGLWLFPFGILVLRSGLIPKVFGILLIVGCVSYLVDSSVALLLPQQHEAVARVLGLPLAAGELGMVLWLLIRGVRPSASVSA